MAVTRTTVSSGHPFNIPENIVYNSVSGSWIEFANAVRRPARIQGVYWSATEIGAVLQIRDIIITPTGQRVASPVWYKAECTSTDQMVDLLPAHVTLFTPFEYHSTSAGDIIMVYGEYV